MNTKSLALIIPTIILLNACINKRNEFRINLVEQDSFEINTDFFSLSSVKNLVKKTKFDSTTYLYFQNFQTKKILLYELMKDTVINIVGREWIDQSNYFGLFFNSNDLFYSFSNNSSDLLLKGSTGEITKTFKINQNYTAVVTPNTRLAIMENYCLLGNSSFNIGFGTRSERIKYYKSIKPILLINLDDSIQCCKAISEFPDKYTNTGNSFYDPFPSFCFGNNKEICVSFGADDYISLYHDSTLFLRKKVKSIYVDDFNPYPDDKQFDMLFLKNYIIEEPKFLSVVFDPWENVYYRIVKHRQGQNFNDNVDYSWSVIIFDSELNVLGEEKYSYKYKPDIFIPTPFGIIMAKESVKHLGKTTLTLFKINRNDK